MNFESPVFSGMRVRYVRARDSVLLIQVEILQLRNSDLLVFDESSQNVNRYEPCQFHIEGLRLLLRINVDVMGLVSSSVVGSSGYRSSLRLVKLFSTF